MYRTWPCVDILPIAPLPFDNGYLTPPAFAPTLSPTANADGWNNSDVSLSWGIGGLPSGTVTTGCGDATFSAETVGTSVACTAYDAIGTLSTASVTVKIDKTPPTIAASAKTVDGNPYTPGTWTNQPVSIHLTCSDALSGIASCLADTTLSGNGSNQSAAGTAQDVAGNSASASVGPINIDRAISLGQRTGAYRTPVTVSVAAGGFNRSEIVRLYWDSTNSPAIKAALATSTGALSTAITIPDTTAGWHTLIAVGVTSHTVHNASFKVTPAMTLASTAGVPGASDTAVGYGFAAGETVGLQWGSATGPMVGSGLASSNGAVSIAFHVPAAPYGKNSVYVVGASSGTSVAATYTVRAVTALAPSSGARGSTVTLSGQGFGANETVTATWSCSTATCLSKAVLATVTTDGTGSFSTPITIPANATLQGVFSIGMLGATSKAFAAAIFRVTS